MIDFQDVNGFSTFQDTNTGYVWMDLDNFYDSQEYYNYWNYVGFDSNGIHSFYDPLEDRISAAQAAGFTFASRSEVVQLLDTLPMATYDLNSNLVDSWSTYAPIMGTTGESGAYSPTTEMISGVFAASSQVVSGGALQYTYGEFFAIAGGYAWNEGTPTNDVAGGRPGYSNPHYAVFAYMDPSSTTGGAGTGGTPVQTFTVSAVPEPSSYAMMAMGLGLIGFMAARRRKTESN